MDTTMTSSDDRSYRNDGRVVIEARGLTKRYGERTVVDNLDLEITRGTIFGLLGPNGAGKTTTILMLLGLTEPSAGSARVLGLDPLRDSLEIKRRVGYLPDDVGFYPALSARENLRYTARLNRLPSRHADRVVDDLLHEVGLTDAADRRVGGYSRGMRQRLGLADALVKDPQILVLDEPTVNIDPVGVREITALVRRLRDDRGLTVLLSSHLLHQVQEVCDEVAMFISGQMVARGTVEELAGAGRHSVVIDVTTGSDPDGVAREVMDSLAATIDGLTAVITGAGRWRVEAPVDVRARIARELVDAGVDVLELGMQAVTLDEVYADRYELADRGDRAHQSDQGATAPVTGEAA